MSKPTPVPAPPPAPPAASPSQPEMPAFDGLAALRDVLDGFPADEKLLAAADLAVDRATIEAQRTLAKHKSSLAALEAARTESLSVITELLNKHRSAIRKAQKKHAG